MHRLADPALACAEVQQARADDMGRQDPRFAARVPPEEGLE